MLQAYGQLEAEGYVETTPGSGTYVGHEIPDFTSPVGSFDPALAVPSAPVVLSPFGERALAAAITPRRQALPYDFVYGFAPPDDKTVSQWQRALRKAAERLPLDYAPPEGDPGLREAIARYLYRSRAIRADTEQIVITSGSQQALSLISKVLFESGDTILVEEPSYQGARHIFRADGLRLVARPVGEEGLDVAGFSGDARGVYVTPSHQFPTGVTMPLARRLKLLAWAEDSNAVILEDDYDSEYRYEGRPLEAIQGLDTKGRVLYIGTFSKVLFPALRIGYLALAPNLVPVFTRAKWLADRQASSLEQRALAELIASGEFDQHLRRARARNRSRRAKLLGELRKRFGDRIEISGANAGIHLLAWLSGWSEEELVRCIELARGRGVGLYSIAPYYEGPAPRVGLLFGYGNLDEKAIEEGIRRVEGVFREVREF